MLNMKSTQDGWVSRIPDPLFDDTGTVFLTILPINDGERGNFQQVCQADSTAMKYTALTSAPMTVVEVLAWDLINHYV